MAAQEPAVYVEVPRRYLIARTKPMQWDKGKQLVENAEGGKFRIPSVSLNQQARQERGYEDPLSKNGNLVLQGVLYRQAENNVLLRTGLPYLHSSEAVLAHSQNREYDLEGCTSDEINRAISEGLPIDSKYLDANGNLVILCRELGSSKYGLWFFGGEGTEVERSKRAEESGRWLINSPQKIADITVLLDNQSYSKGVGKDYATQFWFRGLGSWSGLDGRLLPCGSPVLGVFDSAKGAAQKK